MAQDGTRLLIEVSAGELLDKITILQIKSQRLKDQIALHHVRTELESLLHTWCACVPHSPELQQLTSSLRAVNETLWDVEDRIRACERDGDFGPTFVALARDIYRNNDRRAALKREVNNLLGSRIVEQKAYTQYARAA